MTTVDRIARTTLAAALCAFLIGVTVFLMGSAVAQPPTQCRGFEFSQATTPVPSGSDVVAELQQPGVGPTASVLITNDGTASTDSDLIVALSAVTAAAPSTTAVSTSFRLRPGNQFNIDGRWARVALRGATATVTSRIIATY